MLRKISFSFEKGVTAQKIIKALAEEYPFLKTLQKGTMTFPIFFQRI